MTKCNYCGEKLASDIARQCFNCGWDWHNVKRPINNMDPAWNSLGLDYNDFYVVEFLEDGNGVRTIGYRRAAQSRNIFAKYETVKLPARVFVELGYYGYVGRVPLIEGRKYGFDSHGRWLTEEEIDEFEKRLKAEIS